MALFELVMPKLGESVQEATITKWFVKEGDRIEEDSPLLEIATDKVDSEIPSPVAGIVRKVLFPESSLVPVGVVIAQIDTGGESGKEATPSISVSEQKNEDEPIPKSHRTTGSSRFYSPLIKSIASKEGIHLTELDSISGSGSDGRVTKNDVLNFLSMRQKVSEAGSEAALRTSETKEPQPAPKTPAVPLYEGDEVVEMDRMRRLIAEHMVMSKRVSPHVTSVADADVTALVLWRNRIKDAFQAREKEKITFMPVFIEAVARALKDFPGVNASVDGERIIYRKSINVGIAVSLPDGNLIVPVIKHADRLNLTGITKELNRLAQRAREGKLMPDDIQAGTFTITNFGSFDNLIGTPVINQPQVAILATGAIKKVPAVVETPEGDMIAVRHKMFLSLSYDHRIVDGALGGAFLRRVAEYLEKFDTARVV